MIGKLLGATGELKHTCHVEAMKGSLAQNVAYCAKEGSYTEVGDKPKQGLRVDLADVKDQIVAGKLTMAELLMSNPMAIHQYGRTIAMIEEHVNMNHLRTEMPLCMWYFGPTGVGKTHRAMDGWDPAACYSKVGD